MNQYVIITSDPSQLTGEATQIKYANKWHDVTAITADLQKQAGKNRRIVIAEVLEIKRGTKK